MADNTTKIDEIKPDPAIAAAAAAKAAAKDAEDKQAELAAKAKSDEAAKAVKAPDLLDEIELYEHNHDPVTSEPTEGYQPPKKGKVVKVTEDDHHIDVRTEDKDGYATIHHGIAHKHKAVDEENYWDHPAAK